MIHLYSRVPFRNGGVNQFYCGKQPDCSDFWTDDRQRADGGSHLTSDYSGRNIRPELADCPECLAIYKTHGVLSLRGFQSWQQRAVQAPPF